MGTNRRKAVKDRKKRLEWERKKQAAKVAQRLLGTKRTLGIDIADGTDKSHTWTWKFTQS